VPTPDTTTGQHAFLARDQIDLAAKRLGGDCGHASAVGADDAYRTRPTTADDPVFRIVCGDIWFDVDGAAGELSNRLDPSRRAYRWLFGGLHTLDFAWLKHPPWLRSTLIVALCGFGFAFSLSGAVLGWRRLRNTVAGTG